MIAWQRAKEQPKWFSEFLPLLSNHHFVTSRLHSASFHQSFMHHVQWRSHCTALSTNGTLCEEDPVERASGLEHPIGSSSIPTCSSEIFSVAPSSVAKKLPLRHFLHKCLRHQSIFQIKRLLVTSRLTVLLKYSCMIVNIQRLRLGFFGWPYFYLSWLQPGTKRIDFYKSFSAPVLVFCTSKYKKETSRPVKGHLIKVCFQLKPNLLFIPYSVPVLWQLP